MPFAIELLSPDHLLALATFFTPSAAIPRDLQHPNLVISNAVESAWKSLRTELILLAGTSSVISSRKRRRSVGENEPMSDAMEVDLEKSLGGEPPGRRKKSMWRDSVGQILSTYMTGEITGWENEGLETFISRIARFVITPQSTRLRAHTYLI